MSKHVTFDNPQPGPSRYFDRKKSKNSILKNSKIKHKSFILSGHQVEHGGAREHFVPPVDCSGENLDMNQETARNLLEHGATLIIIDVPPGTEIGIDVQSWRTGQRE